MVDTDVADRPDIFLLDRRIRREDHARRNVEIDIVGKGVSGVRPEPEDVPEAKPEPAHWADEQLLLCPSESAVERFPISSGIAAGILHTDSHTYFPRIFSHNTKN